MDVVRALYLDMTGQAVEAAPAKEGRKWLVEDCDVVSSLRLFRDGKLAFGEWLRSLRGIDETALFNVDDLVPAVWMVMRDLAKLGKRPVPADSSAVRVPAARTAA
jgi:predicted ATP-grasp superfamily ATP-dependent carboligase